MKKKIAIVLIVCMLVSITGCGGTNKNEPTNSPSDISTENPADNPSNETTTNTNNDIADEQSIASPDPLSDTQPNTNEENTLGKVILQDFRTRIEGNSKIEPQEMADALITNDVIFFKATTQEMEEGYLNGFNNEVTGFEKCVMFAPIISTIPFVGYIFMLKDVAEAEDFAAKLKENANPRWNLCTEADETIVDAQGNVVFFLMSQMEIED